MRVRGLPAPVVIALALAAAPAPGAHADTFSWDDAAEGDDPPADSAARAAYELAMVEGDKFARLAAAATSTSVRRKRITAAVAAYERATEALPAEPEPHLRAGEVLFGLEIDCERAVFSSRCPDRTDPKVMRRVLHHWHAFERKAPLDPRVTDLLFERALLHTKLATEADLRAAVLDYEALLDRVGSDMLGEQRLLSLANLAEALMMTGDLPAAIERYAEAIAIKPNTSFLYGLAVAYDRDEQGAKAREVMRALGETQFESWAIDVAGGNTFYVPEGEVFYYAALAREALGDAEGAILDWRRYLRSGAHPAYQPRARANLAALEAQVAADGAKR